MASHMVEQGLVEKNVRLKNMILESKQETIKNMSDR